MLYITLIVLYLLYYSIVLIVGDDRAFLRFANFSGFRTRNSDPQLGLATRDVVELLLLLLARAAPPRCAVPGPGGITPKSSQNHPKITPKLPPNHPQIIPNSFQNNPKNIPKITPKLAPITPTLSQNYPKIIPKLSRISRLWARPGPGLARAGSRPAGLGPARGAPLWSCCCWLEQRLRGAP